MKDDMKLDFFFRNISIQNAIVVQVLCFLMLKVKEVSEGSKYDLQCDLQGWSDTYCWWQPAGKRFTVSQTIYKWQNSPKH